MKKKNILVIVTDQLTWRALPAYGNTYAKTPNIDRIADGGARFDSCYTPCPLCQPARTAFWSGIYPHETGVLSNGRAFPVSDLPESFPTLGSVFSAAGYETVHFGKRHDAGGLRGFTCAPEERIEVPAVSDAWPVNMDTFFDESTARQSVNYLETHGDAPFLMVADFVNPHNICGWVGAFKDEHTDIDPGVPLPELPENFEFDDIENRPVAVQYICCSHNRQAQAAAWKPETYRHYLAAYYHYLERADAHIGQVLDALAKRPDAEDTLLVFFADHGDSMAARGRTTKQVDFYEEVARVPFVFKGPGVEPRAEAIGGAPVSLLDLFPTLCGWAGLPVPEGLRGLDLSAALAGGSLPARPYVASEWHTEWGFTISPGRMIRDGRYKYTKYIEDGGEELYDLETDPYEKRNAAHDPAYCEALERMRGLYRQFLEETGDPFEGMEWKADRRWRSHPLGYHRHEGPSAPMVLGDAFPFPGQKKK
ncbi:MAG: sulfatase-like hydrolase/transferase [Provencibacterium sp.]|jgi:choline-sulfatase|nr:sulfatase-like hydrolase/transferase [Provencibacterium sp.]